MRRKPGSLVPLELAVLEAASRTTEPLHGFELAKTLADARGAKGLTAHGTLYKALGRLADQGLLEAEWEDPEAAAKLLRVGLAKAPEGVDVAELAAWTAVARVLLNLDEAITRS